MARSFSLFLSGPHSNSKKPNGPAPALGPGFEARAGDPESWLAPLVLFFLDHILIQRNQMGPDPAPALPWRPEPAAMARSFSLFLFEPDSNSKSQMGPDPAPALP